MASFGDYSGDFNEGTVWPQKCRSSRNLVTVRTAIRFGDTSAHDLKGVVQGTQGKQMNYELGRGVPPPYVDATFEDADNTCPIFYNQTATPVLDRIVYITFNNTWGNLVHYHFSTNDQSGASVTASSQVGWNFIAQKHEPAANTIWRNADGSMITAADTSQRVPGGTQLQFRVWSMDDGTQGNGATYLQDSAFWASFVFDRDIQTVGVP